MITFTGLKNLATNLSNNTSTANDTLMGQLISYQHRYLIQRYFDNERSFAVQTVGAQSLTTTASLAAGATSATLTAAWSYATGYQPTTFSSGDVRQVLYTNGSAAISWQVGLTTTATTAITFLGMQNYNIPADVSKLKDDTINVGQLKFTTIPIQTRQEWDLINAIPYSASIPQYHFIWNGTLGIFPIPASTNYPLTFNYKGRVPDLSFADYSTGNIAAAGMTVGSTSVTGASTNWSSSGNYPLNTNLLAFNLFLRADPPNGDGLWYQIYQFNSNTSLTLVNPVVNAPNITSSTTYTIGQLPVLQEDFHDMLVYGALMTYYSTINKDKFAYQAAEGEYNKRLALLEDYASSKQVNVDLGQQPIPQNANLFWQGTSGLTP